MPSTRFFASPILQVEQVKGAKGEVERQFNRLYHDKYVPLKAEAARLRGEAEVADGMAAQAAELRAVAEAEQAKASRLAGWEWAVSVTSLLGVGHRCILGQPGGSRPNMGGDSLYSCSKGASSLSSHSI